MTNEYRSGVGAHWPFLSDAGRIVQKDLDIAEYTDAEQPAFFPESSWRPTLVVDDKQVYPSPSNHVEFLGLPSWSPDSTKLAIVAEESDSKQKKLVVWREANSLLTAALVSEGNSVDLFWESNQLVVHTNGSTFQWSEASNSLQDLGAKTIKNPRIAAFELLRQLDSTTGHPPARDPDYWCEACILSILPRATPLNRNEGSEDSR